MRGLGVQFRRATKQLEDLVKRAETVGGDIPPDRCAEIRTLLATCDQLSILTGGVSKANKVMREAAALLQRCDPLAELRLAKLDYIDQLASSCDRIMTAGEMPTHLHLCELATNVRDYEAAHSCGNDAYLLAFAWDVLAQAEAGLGMATDETHYVQAERRYAHARHEGAPMLTLVAGTAV